MEGEGTFRVPLHIIDLTRELPATIPIIVGVAESHILATRQPESLQIISLRAEIGLIAYIPYLRIDLRQTPDNITGRVGRTIVHHEQFHLKSDFLPHHSGDCLAYVFPGIVGDHHHAHHGSRRGAGIHLFLFHSAKLAKIRALIMTFS